MNMPTSSGNLLLTGFEPYDGDGDNPSWQVAQSLHGERLGTLRVVAHRLPTRFASAPAALHAAIDAHAPDLVICLGQAGGRCKLSLERVAINLIDARIADNDGHQPIDIAVDDEGPAAYFSTLPLKSMLDAMQQADVPVHISHSAGTYVCNQVFYALMHRLAGSHVRGGFIHVPFSPRQANRRGDVPSMGLEQILQGMRVAMIAAQQTAAAPVPVLSGGSEH